MENKTGHLRVIEAPDRDYEQQIALFAQQEADWNTTAFDISLVNGFFVVINGPRGGLVATGTASFFLTVWLGNVVVAKSYRRIGLASKIVRALEQEAKSRKPDVDFSLIASQLGQFVYPKLGFHVVEQVSLYKLRQSPQPAASSLRAILPTSEQHDAAVNLFRQSTGYSRQQELEAIFRKTMQCAVLLIEDTVVAAAWARFTSASDPDDSSGVFLGPVVAKSPDYAISVCSEILCMSGKGKSPNSSRGVSALVLNRRGDNAELNVFKSLGFVLEEELQHMVNSTHRGRGTQSAKIPTPTTQYFALVGFDLG